MGFRNIFAKKPSATAPASGAASPDAVSVASSNDGHDGHEGHDGPAEGPPGSAGTVRPTVSRAESPLGGTALPGLPPAHTGSTAVSSRTASAASVGKAYTPPMSRQNSSASSRTSRSSAPAAEAPPASAQTCQQRRVSMQPDGGHSHHLRNARRQEKLGRMLREIVGTGQKVGNDAVSAVPEFLKQADVSEDKAQLTLMHGLVNKLAKGEVEVGRVDGSSHQWKRSQAAGNAGRNGERSPGCATPEIQETTMKSLSQKYGRCQEVIGRGSYGVVRVSHRLDSHGREQLFAVKEFRKRNAESASAYQDRLMSEFCISSALHHTNIIHTFDLMKDTHGGCCQIMEYCSGGDLYSLILSSGTGLTAVEADCFFKQILRGVVYMHSMGVAHCDLKPENILLTQNGVCKISDFGNGECFRMAWETEVHYSKGVFGSGPYIAPEEFKGKPFDPRAADIWALGVIYMVARTGSYLWRKAHAEEDEHYAKYLRGRKTAKGYGPVERLTPSKCVYVIYSILDPVPTRRITGKQILNSEWGRSIRVCEHAEPRERVPSNPVQHKEAESAPAPAPTEKQPVVTHQRVVQEV